MDESRNPTLLEAVDAVIESHLEQLWTSIPARVEKYDAAHQTVDAQPWVQRSYTNGRGELVAERLPVVLSAPVLFPGAGAHRITWPIATGATVILHFPSVSLDRWLLVGREVDPADPRRHGLSDAFATPTGHAFAGPAKPGTTAPQDAMVVHVGGGLPLKLVSPASAEIVAINSELADLTAKYNDLVAKFNTHLHVTPSGASDAPAAPYHGTAASAPVGSPRVKVP